MLRVKQKYRTTQLGSEYIGDRAYRYVYDSLGNITTLQEGTRGGTADSPVIDNRKKYGCLYL